MGYSCEERDADRTPAKRTISPPLEWCVKHLQKNACISCFIFERRTSWIKSVFSIKSYTNSKQKHYFWSVVSSGVFCVLSRGARIRSCPRFCLCAKNSVKHVFHLRDQLLWFFQRTLFWDMFSCKNKLFPRVFFWNMKTQVSGAWLLVCVYVWCCYYI